MNKSGLLGTCIVEANWDPGPECIKHLRWGFSATISTIFSKIFSSTILNLSAEGGLLRIGHSKIAQENPWEGRQ